MRQIVLDTETTGLRPSEGHRVIEIAAIEIIDYLPTGKNYQQYINPQRDVPETSFKVHGLSYEFLRDKPLFCLLYTSPSPRDATLSRMPSSA